MEAGNGMNSRLPSHFHETITHRPDHPIISTLFMKRYGDSLGDSVFLRDSGPGETEWEVGLKNINGGTWLEKGWEEFVRFYSIKEEYLLMFNYLGNSRFRVIICDKTANEISYPVKTLPVKVEPEEEDGHVFVKERGKRKHNVEMSFKAAPKRRRVRERITSQDSDGSCAKNMKLSVRKKVKACEKAFKSEDPYFTMIHATNLDNSHHHINIPFRFWRSIFAGNIGKKGLNFKLCLSNEETEWPVVVERYRQNETGDYGRICGAGWEQFAKDAKLTVGDVCIFELLKKESTFIVYRFK